MDDDDDPSPQIKIKLSNGWQYFQMDDNYDDDDDDDSSPRNWKFSNGW